jgi:predicted  nucleic acid-binding Zn-ribbon protein
MYREIAGMKAELEAARTMILAYQSKHEEFVSVIKDMGHTIENQDGPYRERYEETMAKLLSVQNELSDARNKISILSSQVDGTVEEQMRFAFQQEITTLQEMAASAYDDLMVKYQAEHSKNLALANALELANKKLRYKGEEVTVKGVN